MIIRHVEDYLDAIQKRFPKIPKEDIKRIVDVGMRAYYTHNNYGADILFKTPGFVAYTGRFFNSNLVFYSYWLIKWKIKLRIKYKRSKQPFNGEYFFGLNEKQYLEYTSQIKIRTKRNKKVLFKNVWLYKLKEEACLNRGYKYIFKYTLDYDCGFLFRKDELYTRNYELIATRDKDNNIIPI